MIMYYLGKYYYFNYLSTIFFKGKRTTSIAGEPLPFYSTHPNREFIKKYLFNTPYYIIYIRKMLEKYSTSDYKIKIIDYC